MNIKQKNHFLTLLLLVVVTCFTHLATAANPPPDFTMPFGLSLAPDTRITVAQKYFVGEIEEANGLLATKKTAKEVVSFYEDALEALGFRIFSKTDTAERVYIAAKRGKGDFFSISNTGDNSEVAAGEIELRFMIRFAQ